MKTFLAFPLAVLTSTLTFACSSSSGGAPGDSNDGGPPIDPATLAACDAYFDAYVASGCVSAQPTGTEQARQKSRFEQACASSFGAPGATVTATAMQACAAAIQASGCTVTSDPNGACAFESKGTLSAGAACGAASECESGSCGLLSNGELAACGECGTPVVAGTACETDLDCGPFAACAFAAGAGSCTAIVYRSVGESCDDDASPCMAGLTCSASGTCAPAGAAGAPCNVDSQCAYPLVCPHAASQTSATCAPRGAVGAACEDDAQCAAGLGCDVTASACATITWAEPGSACGADVRCAVGTCPPGDASICPTVVADGAPCDLANTSETCDAFAACRGGTCLLAEATCK